MPNIICFICGDCVRVDSRSGRGDAGRTYDQLITEVSDISGRSLRLMISTVFPQDAEIQQMISHHPTDPQNDFIGRINKTRGVCGTCYNLLEQVRQNDKITLFSLFEKVGFMSNVFSYTLIINLPLLGRSF